MSGFVEGNGNKTKALRAFGNSWLANSDKA